MSTRRSKVIGSLKHTRYIEGPHGNVKVKTVFPKDISSSQNISTSQSPQKNSVSLPRAERAESSVDMNEEIMFMNLENEEITGTKVA